MRLHSLCDSICNTANRDCCLLVSLIKSANLLIDAGCIAEILGEMECRRQLLLNEVLVKITFQSLSFIVLIVV